MRADPRCNPARHLRVQGVELMLAERSTAAPQRHPYVDRREAEYTEDEVRLAATRPLGDARFQLVGFHDHPAERAICALQQLALPPRLGLGDEHMDHVVPARLAVLVDR